MIIDRDVAEDGTVTYYPGSHGDEDALDIPDELYAQWQAARGVLDDLTTRIERHLVTSDQLDADATNLPIEPE